ncbi:BsuBI/PstI family type II restriction endonuclease [Halomonas sabkhae]|uniref:BsuBI/PstI family type II restriction endonuclease n=1 Tax=Halomonas sabkhae TaxID=626223 RepID=UPI0025B4D820|nr:BsuBI/PstI family type II restriction endonuclease [Halomonas sabkhae]MDN3525090.1 BsuBI/PstI family type II restriction endonuclease [Halomonas sabkhae]
MSKEEKLEEARTLLKALGLPKKQYNNRSSWTFLALAGIAPDSDWSEAHVRYLPIVDIMAFVREHYRDYAPNSRESFRKQTLHQFEQARIVDRNIEDLGRATNSKDNRYSLSEPMMEILKEFPNGDWEVKIEEYKENIHNLQELYRKELELHKIPVRLPDGTEIKLSPGAHNQLHADIVHEFCPRFIGGNGGIVLYIGDTASSRDEGGKLMVLDTERLEDLGVPPMSHDKLPDVVVYDESRKWLFLIEAVTSHGPVSPKRWLELEEALKDCKVGRVYVTAFPEKDEFRKNASELAWETEVWIADEPDHMIHFNGDRFLGPH